jgi:crossover junction endodeoxyribonuclease RusA
VIRLELPLAPSANAIFRAGRGRVYKTNIYKQWLEECSWMIKTQTKESVPRDYILQVVAKRPDKRRRDLDNLLKATSDLLVRTGIVSDDNFCRAIVAEWVDFGPPMVVKIYPLEQQETEWWTEIPAMFRN